MEGFMFNPKYEIRRWNEDVPNLFERHEEEEVYVCYVRYGFIFRKCERVGVDKSLLGILEVCQRYHRLVNIGKDLRIKIRV
jgi:hypothetical protein